MKAAKSENRLIKLDSISPDELQTLFEKGKRGNLLCPACHSPVKLYLGIHEEPHFYHAAPNVPVCNTLKWESSPSAPPTETAEYREQNGFRIPISRTITEEKPVQQTFLTSKEVSGSPDFDKKLVKPSTIDSPYFNELARCGVILDSQQLTAASTTEGPLLVLSGAGSGKTRVLTVRTAFMLTEKKIDPRNIMLVTFTAKAAAEMKQRLLSYPGITPMIASQLVSGTFHSIFYKILIFHQPDQWQRDRLLKWEWERLKILKNAGREIGLDEKEFAYDQALQQIGLWKNSLRFPKDIKPKDDFETSCLSLYKSYEDYKTQTDRYDFDDMLVGCYLLFHDYPELLAKYQERFHYFLVDEFQDINAVQYELIKLLSANSQNVCVVGDDDQSIYSFRGSDPSYILHFEGDFPRAKVIKLTENYRSSHKIVSTANRMIKRNKQRRVKAMKAQHDNGNPPVLFYPYDEEIEATMIVTDIQEKIRQGAQPGDFAILYRTHSMSRAIFERLAASSLPFVIERDAESFYDRKIVKSMLAYMRLALDPEDPKPVSSILSSLFLKQSALQEMKAQTILQDCDFINAFSHVKTGHAFQEKKLKTLPEKIRSLSGLSPSVAIEFIEKDLGFNDYVKKRGDEGNEDKGSDDIRDLKVAARRFETISAFIEHADHMAAMVKEVKQLSKHFQDAIQLTTIHRSKGLEYKSVYLLSAVDGSLPHDFSLEAYRKGETAPLEEERRLMYVAATRAKQELYISVPQTRRGKTAHPSRFLNL